jgi:hypothetical protein
MRYSNILHHVRCTFIFDNSWVLRRDSSRAYGDIYKAVEKRKGKELWDWCQKDINMRRLAYSIFSRLIILSAVFWIVLIFRLQLFT